MVQMKQPHLFVLSGASGTGKTTLSRKVEQDLGLFFSVSVTTRPKRSGEIEGRDYHFLTKAEFEVLRDRNGFLEWAEVHDSFYGTPRAPIEEKLQSGKDILLDLDTQGALRLKSERFDVILIFVKPPSIAELRKRLQSRGTDSIQVIERRIQRAETELEHSHRYDHIVVNSDFAQAVQEIEQIILSYRK